MLTLRNCTYIIWKSKCMICMSRLKLTNATETDILLLLCLCYLFVIGYPGGVPHIKTRTASTTCTPQLFSMAA